ncbi:hypothetical protein CRU99_00950 [Malaciobacter mytili]|uniref:hypothetical protein n=1 Tax=Malaciobacter mytili TaxID=603050 RepID=UPI00100B4250|nr:hypothetical protein [Malaciobacter mytili]RXI48392.1 hypothetical protein CRU99_00950 [Malaciobacter mytili]
MNINNLESIYFESNNENDLREKSYNLEYELTQLKIDNYGKSIIQIRAMGLTISGILFTFFYQNSTVIPLLVLFAILLVLIFIENNHYCEQYKLNVHIMKLEKDFNRINRFRFTLGKVLSSHVNFDIRLKLLSKSWLLFILLCFNMYAIYKFYDSDLSKIDNKLVTLNNDYKKSLLSFYKLNDDLLFLSNDINSISDKKYNLEFDIYKLKKYKSILNAKYEELKDNNKKLEIEKIRLLYDIKKIEEYKEGFINNLEGKYERNNK